MPRMTFIVRDGSRREVEAPVGLSVLEIAHRNGIDLFTIEILFLWSFK